VQESGCAALQKLALNNDKNKVTIAAEGGITAILSAMKFNLDNANVQEYGCGALSSLTKNDSNRVFIAEAGWIITMLSAIVQFRKGLN
jgi:hypothetical protein